MPSKLGTHVGQYRRIASVRRSSIEENYFLETAETLSLILQLGKAFRTAKS